MDDKVILGDLFIADLIEIVAYLASRADERTARRIGNELIDKALSLGKNPFVGQEVHDRPGARKICAILIGSLTTSMNRSGSSRSFAFGTAREIPRP